MSRTVVLTLGRLPPALDLARSFAAAGWRVVVTETYGMHLARMSRAVARSVKVTSPQVDANAYLENVLDVVREENATLLVPVSEETLRVANLKDRLPTHTQLFAADYELLEQVHDKYRFAKLAASLGLTAPQSWLPGEYSEQGEQVIVKPRHSCSGRGVRIVPASDTVDAAADDVVQERVEGVEVSGFAIAESGKLFCPQVYRGTVLSGSVAVCFERVEHPAVVEWMQTFVRETAYTGFIAFDFIIDDKHQPFAIECNPRATSGVHLVPEAVLAGQVAGELVDAERGYKTESSMTESWSCYTAVLSRIGKPKEFARAFGELRRARDVTWSRKDPLPFLLMPINTARIIVDAVRYRATFAEVAVRDIEWRPEDVAT